MNPCDIADVFLAETSDFVVHAQLEQGVNKRRHRRAFTQNDEQSHDDQGENNGIKPVLAFHTHERKKSTDCFELAHVTKLKKSWW